MFFWNSFIYTVPKNESIWFINYLYSEWNIIAWIRRSESGATAIKREHVRNSLPSWKCQTIPGNVDVVNVYSQFHSCHCCSAPFAMVASDFPHPLSRNVKVWLWMTLRLCEQVLTVVLKDFHENMLGKQYLWYCQVLLQYFITYFIEIMCFYR